MSRIYIRRDHQLDIEDIKERLKPIEEELERRFKAFLEWDGNTAAIIGRGVVGKVELEDTVVTVTMTIGLWFIPLTPLIRAEVERKLDRALAM